MENCLSTDHQAPQPLQLDHTLKVNSIFTKSVDVESGIGPKTNLLDESGKFAPGNPGGPGRPRTRLISEALKQALASGKADELKDMLMDLAVSAKDSVKLAAIQEITDRTEGKAVQNIRHAGVFMVMAPSEEVLAAAFGGIAPSEDE